MVHTLAASGTKVRDPPGSRFVPGRHEDPPKSGKADPTVVGCNAIWLKGQLELLVQLMVCSFRLIEGAIMGGAF